MGLGLAACAAVAAAGWYLASAPMLPEPALPGVAPRGKVVADDVATPRADFPVLLQPAALAPARSPATPSAEAEALPSLATLERRFYATRATADRVALAQEIAGQNNAGAVLTLARIFPLERHPDVRAALLASLNDIDHDEAPDARLALLATALRGQPREVRTTALDSLAQLDDPRVLPLLKTAMQKDGDKEVRDTATALYRARLAADAP